MERPPFHGTSFFVGIPRQLDAVQLLRVTRLVLLRFFGLRKRPKGRRPRRFLRWSTRAWVAKTPWGIGGYDLQQKPSKKLPIQQGVFHHRRWSAAVNLLQAAYCDCGESLVLEMLVIHLSWKSVGGPLGFLTFRKSSLLRKQRTNLPSKPGRLLCQVVRLLASKAEAWRILREGE